MSTYRPFDKLFDALQAQGHRLEVSDLGKLGDDDKSTLILILEAVSGDYQGKNRKVLYKMSVQADEHIHQTSERFHDFLREKKVVK